MQTPSCVDTPLEELNAVYPTQLYFDIASLQAQDRRYEAARERLQRQAAQSEPSKPSDPRTDAAYRRLAVAILGLDVSTLIDALRSARHQPFTTISGHIRDSQRRMA